MGEKARGMEYHLIVIGNRFKEWQSVDLLLSTYKIIQYNTITLHYILHYITLTLSKDGVHSAFYIIEIALYSLSVPGRKCNLVFWESNPLPKSICRAGLLNIGICNLP